MNGMSLLNLLLSLVLLLLPAPGAARSDLEKARAGIHGGELFGLRLPGPLTRRELSLGASLQLLSLTAVLARACAAQTEAEASRKNALDSTRTSIGRLGGFLNDGTLSAKNAELLLGDARSTLEDLARKENQSPEISAIEVLLLLSYSDVRVALGDHDDALKRAERAAAISERLLKRDPYDQNLMRQIYAASFRIGDEKAFAGDNREAERQYNKALGFARQRGSIDPDNPDRKRDVVFILNKLADLERLNRPAKPALIRRPDRGR